MASLRRGGQNGLFALLLLSVVVITAYQLVLGQPDATVRYASTSLLPPLVASALLPLRRTAVVGATSIASTVLNFGFLLPVSNLSGRIVVISSIVVAVVLSLLSCWARANREAKLGRVMIARDRLTLLSVATTHIGNTLEVDTTARELVEAAVPRFADLATVDLADPVLRGEEPRPGWSGQPPFELRRVAQRSVLEGAPEAVLRLDETRRRIEDSVPARVLASGRPERSTGLEGPADLAGWLGVSPERAEEPWRRYGFHSGIAVPLRARGTTLGVAVFLRHRTREPFDADDLVLAQEIAARAAVCVDNARRFTREHRNSLALQRSLLPRRLPKLAAVDVASRYLPADSAMGVGGDWFDVIPLSGARVALVVGDVVGHGVHASATMGRLRSTVRTLADIDLPPDELLTHLDDVVIRLRFETEPADAGRESPTGGFGATCLYAVYDPVSRHCTVARAGHPAPVLVRPSGTAEVLELPAGPPLGLGGLPFESAELDLPEETLLALYTNGLVESRGSRDPDRGFDELRRVLSRPNGSLEELCDTVLDTVLAEQPTDDVALLLARTRALDASHVATWEIPDDPTAVASARELATSQLAGWGMADAAFTAELVVSELVTNAIRHADGPIQLRLIRERGLICEVSDSTSTSPHLRRARVFDESGRGLFIIARLTERWGTRHRPGGKTIWAELAP
ncbi:SpoIIE family protein phosphatase [Streptomyces sp. DSM 44915]|uniref:SpoIIE family protein phosphatase n=1 Tax=Streptomyces chisholmiae TaxID=3075540 RepID=A0ABU2JKN2_9ACTN|nr:SpoIIE family protein phosphatase [Streptomyces sp. DSM 44915]MDT0265544.1 SpoIIE family protein phosphatase [Streptomyces sp. DSM 44915]